MNAGAGDSGLDVIMSERRQLINLAYRMLGSLAEAEDAVQETYARWYAMSRQEQEAIKSPGAWLTTVASRICLNVLGSARVRREAYVGDWIPEPLPEWTDGAATDPADRVTLDESVNMAFLVVLESMTPAERVAFVLHDVFRYPFAEVADIVGRTPAACRKLASSARRRISAARTSASPTAQQAGIVRAFKQAWEAKDIDALVGLLDPDATAIGDGGGRATTFLEPIEGGELIAQAWVHLAGRKPDNMRFVERTVNGQPGLVAEQDGVTVTVFAFDVADGRIKHIWVIRNPEKLRTWMTALAGPGRPGSLAGGPDGTDGGGPRRGRWRASRDGVDGPSTPSSGVNGPSTPHYAVRGRRAALPRARPTSSHCPTNGAGTTRCRCRARTRPSGRSDINTATAAGESPAGIRVTGASSVVTVTASACQPAQAWRVLFGAASTGGAYNRGCYGAYGRLAAWQSLAGISGAAQAAAAAEVERQVHECDWFSFDADTAWFEQVAWDIGVAALRPGRKQLAVLAATDTD